MRRFLLKAMILPAAGNGRDRQSTEGYHNLCKRKVFTMSDNTETSGMDQIFDRALEQNPHAAELLKAFRPVMTRQRQLVESLTLPALDYSAIDRDRLRAGVPIGCKVTLRGARMYYFLDKLFNAALPRIRDFRGVSGDSFDGRGNYTLGLKEQLVFPEIEYDKVDKIRGMDITIVTSARTDEEGLELLRLMGLPVRTE